MVTITRSEYMPPKVADLLTKFNEMVASADNLEDVYDKAIHVFLTMARNHFFMT